MRKEALTNRRISHFDFLPEFLISELLFAPQAQACIIALLILSELLSVENLCSESQLQNFIGFCRKNYRISAAIWKEKSSKTYTFKPDHLWL